MHVDTDGSAPLHPIAVQADVLCESNQLEMAVYCDQVGVLTVLILLLDRCYTMLC